MPKQRKKKKQLKTKRNILLCRDVFVSHKNLKVLMNNLFIISGPSGAGEDSIINALVSRLPIERVITTTSRPMRNGDSEGNPYYFITEAEFKKKIAAGDFIEYAQQYNDNYYGVTKEEIARVSKSGKIGIWKIEYQGVMTAKKLFPGIIAILLTAPLEVLENRIRRRDNPDEALLQERMAYTKKWLEHADIYDYKIENEEGKLDKAIEDTIAIIEKHRGQSE